MEVRVLGCGLVATNPYVGLGLCVCVGGEGGMLVVGTGVMDRWMFMIVCQTSVRGDV